MEYSFNEPIANRFFPADPYNKLWTLQKWTVLF